MTAFLQTSGLTAFYGPTQVLFGVDLELERGQVLALMGRNGTGKSTTVSRICGLLPAANGQITLNGRDISRASPHTIARVGVGLVPEGRRCFGNLTVRENLICAARHGHWDQARVHALLPRLAERSDQNTASLSGGEQQMLAIGRALMTNPSLLILDEATEGLAPIVRQEIWAVLAQLKAQTELSILVIDKSPQELAPLADRVTILERGRTVWSAPFAELGPAETRRYLGV